MQSARRVLIIDDYELACQIITMILTKMGFEVDSAFNADMGLEMASKHGYSLILLDLNLSDIDGLEVVQKIKQYSNLKHAKIFAFTGREVDFELDCKKHGFDGVLTKPFTNQQIQSIIQKL